MPPVPYALIDACRTLFGDQVQIGPEFLSYLQPSGAKVAFRAQAKQHHPDYFCSAPPEVRARQTARFREIHQAYHLLSSYLERRRPPRQPASRPSHRHAPRSPGATGPAPQKRCEAPPMPMEFGIFAYYRGAIDYRDLIDALVWQRRQRPALGTLACQWGWLNEAGVRRILGHRGSGGRFGRKAMDLGLLTPVQVEILLRHQRAHQQRIGQYFVERGLMSSDAVEALAADLQRHNARFTGGRQR